MARILTMAGSIPDNHGQSDQTSVTLSGEVSLDTDTGFLVGGVLGYNWGDTGFRSELELSYSQANLDGFDVDWDNERRSSPGLPDRDDLDFDGDVSVTYLFGNLWYGFGHMMNMGGISPYIGGGLGVGFVNVDIDRSEASISTPAATRRALPTSSVAA
jgi:opacity protein-like surface antigen